MSVLFLFLSRIMYNFDLFITDNTYCTYNVVISNVADLAISLQVFMHQMFEI